MFRKKVKVLSLLLGLGDYLLITLVFIIAYYLRFNTFDNFFQNQFFSFLLLYILTWVVLANVWNLYTKYWEGEFTRQIGRMIQVLVLHLLVIVAFNGILKTYFSRAIILNSYGFLLITLPLWRLLFNRILKGYFHLGYGVKNAIFIGDNDISPVISELGSTRVSSTRVMGYFGEQSEKPYPHLGVTASCFEFIEKYAEDIDEVYCSFAAMNSKDVNRLINIADNNLIRIIFIPEARGLHLSKLKFDFVGQQPVMVLRPLPLDEPLNRIWKRLFDLIFSILVCSLILIWLVPIIAILVKLSSKGPVFFKQKRSGLNNDLFWCYKFRTMKVNTESDSKQAEKGDSRITPIGAFLRKTSLDEMPQFLNVLIGNMSVVGPRPHMKSHTEHYSKIINKFMLRHFVKPGITGLSQVKGLRGETTEPGQMRNRVRIDIFYIEYWSFLLDLKIVYLTVYNIFKGDDKAF